MSEYKIDSSLTPRDECCFVNEHGHRCEAPSVATITPASRRPDECATACADHVDDLSSEGCDVQGFESAPSSGHDLGGEG